MWVQNSSFTTFKPIVVGHEPERSQFHPPTLRRVFWRRNLGGCFPATHIRDLTQEEGDEGGGRGRCVQVSVAIIPSKSIIEQ